MAVKYGFIFFVVAPCMLMSSLFVQILHTNYYKIVNPLAPELFFF